MLVEVLDDSQPSGGPILTLPTVVVLELIETLVDASETCVELSETVPTWAVEVVTANEPEPIFTHNGAPELTSVTLPVSPCAILTRW